VDEGRPTAISAGMEIDLARLAKQISDELDAYVVPERHPAALGTPLPEAWYVTELAAMRSALVPPYWTKIRDQDSQSGEIVTLEVAVVADDGEGYLVALDPRADGEFVLALRELDPDAARRIDVVSCGVRGDAVGCFLSR
jgi:hypothetical protein